MCLKITVAMALILCATLGVATGHAQSITTPHKTTLVDLEAQSKAKKKAKTTKSTAAKKDTTDAQKTASGQDQSGQTQSGTQSGSTQQPPASGDPDDKKIYKAGDIPDTWKFKKEKDKDSKKAGAPESTGTSASPAPAAAAEPAPAAAAPVAAAPAPAPAPAPATASTPAPAATTTPAPAAAAPAPAPAPAPAAKTTTQPKKQAASRPAKPASSGGMQAWQDAGYISGNVGWQTSSATFSDSRSIPMEDGNPEPRHFAANYEVAAAPTVDAGAAFRVWKNLGIGAAVTYYNSSKDIPITGGVPHPFFFNTDRAVSGSVSGKRTEIGIHIDAVWVVPVNKKLQIAAFGGPSFFNAKQTIVSDFTYSQSYPYDTATFGNAVTTDESKTVTGFNIGADVGYFFNDTFGVGGTVRFSRGTLTSSIGDLDIGGPELAGGVRIRLHQSSAPKAPKRGKK
jgi:hypothetical protein